MNDADAIGHLLRDAQLMGRDKDRHALVRFFFEQVLQHAGVMRIESDHRFVHHENFRLVQQRGGDGHALARAVRESFDLFSQIGLEIEPFDQFVGAGPDTRLLHLKKLPGEAKEFPRGQLVVEEREVGHVGQPAAGFEGLVLHVEPGHPGLACLLLGPRDAAELDELLDGAVRFAERGPVPDGDWGHGLTVDLLDPTRWRALEAVA